MRLAIFCFLFFLFKQIFEPFWFCIHDCRKVVEGPLMVGWGFAAESSSIASSYCALRELHHSKITGQMKEGGKVPRIIMILFKQSLHA